MTTSLPAGAFLTACAVSSALILTGCGNSGTTTSSDTTGKSTTSSTSKSTASSSKSSEKSSTKTSTKTSTKKSSGKALKVYATTGYIADAIKNVAPNAEITTMVGPGGDPHTFQPATKDIKTIKSSDLVIWNGLHLEARMLDLLKGLGDKQVNVGSKVPKNLLLEWPEEGENGEKLKDPHIWNSPKAWKSVVNTIADSFAAADKDNADEYKANATKYNKAIDTTVEEAKEKLKSVPKDKRILISGHDAFNYFGKTFDFEVEATDVVSSEGKLSAKELSALAGMIVKKKVPVIFLDNQANPQAIKSLKEAVKAKGGEVKIADDELYADTLGSEKSVDTYLEVLAHNAEAVSKALGTK